MHMLADKKVEIVEFDPRYQRAVEELVLPIQQIEFAVKITREEQPDLINIADVFQTGKGNFWVARQDGAVVGTIGVVDIGNQMVALKKMFVRSDLRGKQIGISQALMDEAKRWCGQAGVTRIYWGTTAQMLAAHRFYEKNGFVELTESELPKQFPVVHVDSKFYVCAL